MADIQGVILSKYGIDIAQENIFKLYKVDAASISEQDLEAKIADTRKRWNTSINGANEKNAERDRARLEKADKYEAILKDAKLRKEVFNYYNKPTSSSAGGSASAPGEGNTQFAKEYFQLVATTKTIKKEDVEFFFKYYQSERKNKKAILEMLSKELKISGLGTESSYSDEKQEVDIEGKKKDESSPLITNLFQEATVLNIRRAVEKYEEAAQNKELCQRYPKLKESLYDFLEIDSVEDAKQFTEVMSTRAKEVYAVRQERGTEYIPLCDLFNKLQSIGDYKDVVDNIKEVKLLLKYPNLTSYMYSFVDMKPATVKGMINVANKDYVFRDDTDFILNYYQPIHDNFGISDSGISRIIRKAEKKAKQNKLLNEIDEKLGRIKKRKISVGAEIIHWLVYWPIVAVYFVFEVAKAVFTELHRFTVPVFAALFAFNNLMFPTWLKIENLLVLRKIFFKAQWLSFLENLFGKSTNNAFETILLSLMAIVIFLAIYIIPPLFVSIFVAEFVDDFNKRFDWMGYERTFQQIFMDMHQKTEDQFIANRGVFVKKKIPKIMINLVSLALLIAIIHFTPIGLHKLGEVTGYGQKSPSQIEQIDKSGKKNDGGDASAGATMVVTEKTANVRSGPGTNYDVVSTVSQGQTYKATGNQKTASNGRIWYEIYLDNKMSQTGWASEKVIKFQ